MVEWKEYTVADVISTVIDYRGKTPKKLGGEWSDSGYRALSAKNIKTGKIVQLDSIRYVSEEMYKYWMKEEVQKEDIIITSEAPFGQIYYWDSDEKIVLSQRLFAVRVNQRFYPKYIYFYMTSSFFQAELAGRATGTTVVGLRQPELLKCKIFAPDYQEQKRIADTLWCLEQKINNNEEINNNLEQQMEALYKSWFIDFEPFGGTKPSSWKNANIYSISNIIYGAPFASKMFNTDGIGQPIIRIRDLKSQEFVTYTTEKHPKGHLINPGDIVVGMDGEFRPYIWGNKQAWLNQRVCIFENKRPKGKAFLLLTIKPLLKVIEQTQVATTVIHIGKKDFDAFEIILPDIKALNQFDEITTPMMEQIVNSRLENKRLSLLRDTLLPKLMSGEFDVSDIDL